MSFLVVGISHNSAPVSLLERVAPGAGTVPKLVQAAAACAAKALARLPVEGQATVW